MNWKEPFTMDKGFEITSSSCRQVSGFIQQDKTNLIEHRNGTTMMHEDFQVTSMPPVTNSSAFVKETNSLHSIGKDFGVKDFDSFAKASHLIKSNSTELLKRVTADSKEKPIVSFDVFGTAHSLLSGLDSYMKTHSGAASIYCAVCGSTFTHTSSLKRHMRIHTGEKPFQCEACGTSFKQSSHLQRHIRTHTGEKPFHCIICESRFSQSSSLNHHMRTHTGEKPFNCEFCGFRFTCRSSLNDHIRTHTGEKPYVCEICGSNFAQSSNLHVHMRIHTGEKPFPCEICGSAFSTSSKLKCHLKTHCWTKIWNLYHLENILGFSKCYIFHHWRHNLIRKNF